MDLKLRILHTRDTNSLRSVTEIYGNQLLPTDTSLRIVSCPDYFSPRSRKMRSGDETTLRVASAIERIDFAC